MTTVSPIRTVTIRPMHANDLDAVYAIEQRSFSSPWTMRSYRFELLHNRASLLWVAEAEGQDGEKGVVGMIVVWLLVDHMHVSNIAVHPAYRRQGIGGKLLCAALREGIGRDMREAGLEVRESNRAAQALYRSFGFKVVGRRRGYYRDNGEDAIMMELSILRPERLAKVDCVDSNG